MAPGFGKHIFKPEHGEVVIKDVMGRHVLKFSGQADGSLALVDKLKIYCPVHIGYCKGDETVHPSKAGNILQKIEAPKIDVTAFTGGMHRFNDLENEQWLEKLLA